jgi:hypothetical protein
MPDTKLLDKSLGSRHRAALGITEETDAVVVVVSEERGSISFCFNGNIVSNLDGASLRQALLGLFGQRTRKKKSAPHRRQSGHTGSTRISAAPPSSGTPATSHTGSILLGPVGRDAAGPPPSQPPVAPQRGRPMTPARIETPKPMAAVDPPTSSREPPENG